MRTSTRGFAIGVTAVALVSTACADATRTISPDHALYEGAPVYMSGTMQVSAIVNGQAVMKAVHEWAVDGVVRNGAAEASRSPGKLVDGELPVLAISDDNPLSRSPSRRRFEKFVDAAGVTHDFLIHTGGRGGPVNSLAHLENGKVAQVIVFDWQKVRGGWKAAGISVTQFKEGKPVVTARSGTKLAPTGVNMMQTADDPCMFDAEYAALSGNCDGAPTFGGGGSGSGGGGGGTCPSCTAEMMSFLTAGWAVGMTTGDMLTTTAAVSAWRWGGAGGALVSVGWLAYRWIVCMECSEPGSGGGGGSGFLIEPPGYLEGVKETP